MNANLIWQDDEHVAWSLHLERPYAFRSPCPGEEFALLLHVADPHVSDDEQDDLSRAFIDQRCRYAVCAGHACSSWDDSIDMASVIRDIDEPDAEGAKRLVLTTWHEDEPIDEVAFYFAQSTRIDDDSPTRFVIVELGGTSAELDAINARVVAYLREWFEFE